MTREIICKTWNNRDSREIFAISHLYFDIQLISWLLLKVLFSLVSIWNAEDRGLRDEEPKEPFSKRVTFP